MGNRRPTRSVASTTRSTVVHRKRFRNQHASAGMRAGNAKRTGCLRRWRDWRSKSVPTTCKIHSTGLNLSSICSNAGSSWKTVVASCSVFEALGRGPRLASTAPGCRLRQFSWTVLALSSVSLCAWIDLQMQSWHLLYDTLVFLPVSVVCVSR